MVQFGPDWPLAVMRHNELLEEAAVERAERKQRKMRQPKQSVRRLLAAAAAVVPLALWLSIKIFAG